MCMYTCKYMYVQGLMHVHMSMPQVSSVMLSTSFETMSLMGLECLPAKLDNPVRASQVSSFRH